jgi:hypothetical protein
MARTCIVQAHLLFAVVTMPNLDVLWSLPYPERLLAPYQTVTKVGTKGHEDDSKATTDFLEEGAWAAMMSTQTASSPLLGQTRGSMSINQIPGGRLVYAVVSNLPGLPEDAGVVIGSHRLVYAVLGDRDQSRKLSSERSEQVTWDLEVSLQLISIPSSGSV